MPSFEQLILSAPLGFVNTLLKLNFYAEHQLEKLDQIVISAWQQIQLGSTNASDEVKAISFIIRSMKQAQPPSGLSQTANVLASNTVLTKDCIEKILIKVKELSSSEQTEILEQAAMHVSNYGLQSCYYTELDIYNLI
jgi:uncharacterized protein YjaG (DUF416 family)